MASVAKPKQTPRSALKPDEILCEYCTAKCCRYFALPIDTPTEMKDFQFIRWYLLHGQASVFTEDDDWYRTHFGGEGLGSDKDMDEEERKLKERQEQKENEL